MNITIKFKNDIINHWITKKLVEHFQNTITILNIKDTYDINNQNNISIIEDIFFNEINHKNHANYIIVSSDLFFLDKHKLDIVILYTPINIQNLISIIEQKINSINNLYKFKHFQGIINNNILSILDNNTKVQIVFTQNESSILKELIINYNKFTSQQHLLSLLWDIKNQSQDIQSNTIETHINSIRKKLKTYNFDLQIKKNHQSYILS